MKKTFGYICLLSLVLLGSFLYSARENSNSGGSLVIIGGALKLDNEAVYPRHTDIFGKDAIKEIITAGLTDNRQTEAVGLAFTLDQDKKNTPNTRGKGVKLVFSKGKHTTGYWARIKSKSTYSALHVHLDVIPIIVKVTE